MANWAINVHERWLARVRERMKSELLSHSRIHADETTIQVLKEPNREAKKKSRMWLFCSARCDVPAYIFEYHETRKKGVAQEFLAGWSGTLTSDGYKPYFNLDNPGIANTACLVHVRRYFAQIVKIAGGDAKAEASASVAFEARRRIDAMFTVDSKFDDMGPEERKDARDAELHRALQYAVEFWPYVMNVLEDGPLELSNNVAEQAQRIFVAGRKNWLFSDTPRGADASAAVCSVVTTARANGLHPRSYMQWLLEVMPNAGELTDEVVDSLPPWSPRVPDSCRLPQAEKEKAKEMPDDFIVNTDPGVFDDEVANNAEGL